MGSRASPEVHPQAEPGNESFSFHHINPDHPLILQILIHMLYKGTKTVFSNRWSVVIAHCKAKREVSSRSWNASIP